jgi:hypothetical protein
MLKVATLQRIPEKRYSNGRQANARAIQNLQTRPCKISKLYKTLEDAKLLSKHCQNLLKRLNTRSRS